MHLWSRSQSRNLKRAELGRREPSPPNKIHGVVPLPAGLYNLLCSSRWVYEGACRKVESSGPRVAVWQPAQTAVMASYAVPSQGL